MTALPVVDARGAWPLMRPELREGKWLEISEEHADYCLNVLPPIYFSGGFAVSEPTDCDPRGADLFAIVVRVGSRCFLAHRTRAEAPHAARELRDWVKP